MKIAIASWNLFKTRNKETRSSNAQYNYGLKHTKRHYLKGRVRTSRKHKRFSRTHSQCKFCILFMSCQYLQYVTLLLRWISICVHDIIVFWQLTNQIWTGFISSQHRMAIGLQFNVPDKNLQKNIRWKRYQKWTLLEVIRKTNFLTSGLSVCVAIILLFWGSSLILFTCMELEINEKLEFGSQILTKQALMMNHYQQQQATNPDSVNSYR